MLDPVAIGHRIAAREVISLDNLGWIRGPIAKMVVAAGVGLVGGFGTIAVHAATSPTPSVSPDVGPSNQCVALDQHLAVDGRITDHAEPRRRLGHHELPEYVDDRPLDAAEAAGLKVRRRH